MSEQSQTQTAGGIGFVDLLTIVFITLKLLGKITWSWWWVLSPLWIMPIVVLAVVVIIFTYCVIKEFSK